MILAEQPSSGESKHQKAGLIGRLKKKVSNAVFDTIDEVRGVVTNIDIIALESGEGIRSFERENDFQKMFDIFNATFQKLFEAHEILKKASVKNKRMLLKEYPHLRVINIKRFTAEAKQKIDFNYAREAYEIKHKAGKLTPNDESGLAALMDRHTQLQISYTRAAGVHFGGIRHPELVAVEKYLVGLNEKFTKSAPVTKNVFGQQ